MASLTGALTKMSLVNYEPLVCGCRRDYATTKSVTIGLSVSMVLHATILSFGYTMMLIGAVMFTFFTSVWLDLMNALNGTLSYRSNSLSLIKPCGEAETKASDANWFAKSKTE